MLKVIVEGRRLIIIIQYLYSALKSCKGYRGVVCGIISSEHTQALGRLSPLFVEQESSLEDGHFPCIDRPSGTVHSIVIDIKTR